MFFYPTTPTRDVLPAILYTKASHVCCKSQTYLPDCPMALAMSFQTYCFLLDCYNVDWRHHINPHVC